MTVTAKQYDCRSTEIFSRCNLSRNKFVDTTGFIDHLFGTFSRFGDMALWPVGLIQARCFIDAGASLVQSFRAVSVAGVTRQKHRQERAPYFATASTAIHSVFQAPAPVMRPSRVAPGAGDRK